MHLLKVKGNEVPFIRCLAFLFYFLEDNKIVEFMFNFLAAWCFLTVSQCPIMNIRDLTVTSDCSFTSVFFLPFLSSPGTRTPPLTILLFSKFMLHTPETSPNNNPQRESLMNRVTNHGHVLMFASRS